VIVDNRDVFCIASGPSEDHAPLIVDADRVVSTVLATQRLQMVRRRDHEILNPGGRIHRFQFPFCSCGDRLKLQNDLVLKQPARSFVAE
jgi:hypothetical protein